MQTQYSSKITIIVVYVGKLPQLFPFWLRSCEFNPSIEWIVFTDDKTEYKFPPNVHRELITFDQLKLRFQKIFPFKISLDHPYKLCDFKPVFGLAFEDYLVNSDFWGHTDVDLLYGNIRQYFTDSVLDSHDKCLGFGHLALFRNATIVNEAIVGRPDYGGCSREYRRDYLGPLESRHRDQWELNLSRWESTKASIAETVFSTEDGYAFDEWSLKRYGVNDLLLDSGLSLFDERPFANIHIPKGHFELSRFTHLPEQHPTSRSVFSFDRGRLQRHRIAQDRIIETELLYLHLQKRPMGLSVSPEQIDRFLVVPNQIVELPGELNDDRIRRLGRPRFFYPYFFRFKYENSRKKIGRAMKR
ncbi:DUF6625 family protein [Crateriforma conspicua]|uniref:DUF6625 family protein n=1 Tax=Crateriforma conspicua TaxID=2527996 RepID=UPI001188A7BA|nr:DUF6625 family protein [Crateriforma conspicua]QDV65126.1 hypothetical protein Mal65_42960 [Crateriforma conspicua]